MNYNLMGLGKKLHSKIDVVLDRPKLIAIAFGLYLANLNRLPTASVDSSEFFYNNTYSEADCRFIANINENIILDRGLAEETAKRFWKLRYNSVFPDISNITSMPDDSVYERIYGHSRIFDKDQKKLISDNNQTIVELYKAVCDYYIEQAEKDNTTSRAW